MVKALGIFVFAGSASIGVMNNGVKPDRILELVDGIENDNAMHFIHNFPEIPVVLPSVWENAEYLKSLREENYDLMYGNPPCSGLSLARIGASADNEVNCHMYRYFDTVEAVRPKAFILENAPTLLTIGKPILNKATTQLKEAYNFTIIREYGKFHNVAMGRQRTFLVGWRKDVFPTVPTIHMDHQPLTTVKDIIGDLYDVPVGDPSVKNHVFVQDSTRPDHSFDRFLHHLPLNPTKKQTIRWTIIDKYEEFEPLLTEKEKKSLATQLYKQREGLGYWDKSPQRVNEDGLAISLTGYSSMVHPIHDRHLTIREYSRFMGFPDTFEFLDHPQIIRQIAQGVPAKYFEWISKEVLEALKGNRPSQTEHSDTQVVFQHHMKEKLVEFTVEEWVQAPKADDVKTKLKALEV